MTVTLKDVAAACGLSPGTVSRALNHHPSVHQDTVDYVTAMARSMGYYPNRAGKALSARKKPVSIGVLLPSVNGPFFDDVKSGMHKALREYEDLGLTLVCDEVEGWKETDHLQALKRLIKAGCNAFCLCTQPRPAILALLEELKHTCTYIACVNHNLPELKPLFFVGVDFYKSGFLAANLAHLCLRDKPLNVIIVIGLKSLKGHMERVRGFTEGLRYFGRQAHLISLIEGEDNEILTQTLTMEALKAHPEASCLYVATGSAVSGACRAVIALSSRRPYFIATDEIPSTRDYFKEGIIDASICQDPFLQGYYAIKKLYNCVTSGDLVEKGDLIVDPSIRLKAHYL